MNIAKGELSKQVAAYLEAQVAAYLEAQTGAWSPTTLKSERARLHTVLPHLLSIRGTEWAEPKALLEVYTALAAEGYKPYSLKTLFIRLAKLWEFSCPYVNAENPVRFFMRTHAKLFKHAYRKERLSLTFEEARRRITLGLRGEDRDAALALLLTGLRISELPKVIDGHVIGKGGKERAVLGEVPAYGMSLDTLRSRLKAIGLKPHSLRKLLATKLAEEGLTAADRLAIFGWEDIRTAASYEQAKRTEELRARLRGL